MPEAKEVVQKDIKIQRGAHGRLRFDNSYMRLKLKIENPRDLVNALDLVQALKSWNFYYYTL